MNDTSATSAPGDSLLPAGIDTLTTVHFAIIALLALAVIAMIVAGVRRKRSQKAATRVVEQRAADAGVPPQAEEPAPLPEPELPPPPEPTYAPPPPAERPLPDEPIAAAAPLEASPAAEAADAPVAAPSAADGPVTQLKGLGPKVAGTLAERGITTVGQIAALTDGEAAALDADLGPFRGRMMRDRWLEQARFLAAGDRAGFESVFGRL